MCKTEMEVMLEGTGKELSDKEYQEMIKNYEFAVQSFNHVVDDRPCEKHMIVIRKKDPKCIVAFTKYEDLLIYRVNKDFSAWSGNVAELRCICQFLQYVLIDHYDKFKIKDIADVTEEMIKQWLWEYAGTTLKTGQFPSKESVTLHRNAVCQFIYMLCREGKMKHIKKEDMLIHHYVERKTPDGYLRTPQKVAEYQIPLRYYNDTTGLVLLNRDTPDKVLPIFIKMAEIHDPGITFAIVCSSYTGGRTGEICNMRRVDSIYGPGLIRTIEDGEVTAMHIDWRYKYVLRTDGKITGKIKRGRMQEVFGPFVPVVEHYYQKHLKLLEGKPCDDSMPMFLNKHIDKNTGRYEAMTVSGYNVRVKRIYKKVLEYCKNSKDKDLNEFYDKMTAMNYNWGPHSFRHWFTVRLVQYGCNAVQVKDFRGDKAIESAETYLKEKGALRKEFENKSDELGRLLTGYKED